MGQEVIAEKEFPCPCGKGALKIEILEHDVYASGRHSRCTVLCPDCDRQYVQDVLLHALIAREHKKEMDERWSRICDRRRTVGELATERYLAKFTDHVKTQKFKTGMKDALGDDSSMTTFSKKVRAPGALEERIKGSLLSNPSHALKQIGVSDSEIDAELASILAEHEAFDRWVVALPKHKIPSIAVD